MKIGGAPFHFWFIEVIKRLNWLQIIVLNTLQKIGPIILVSYTLYSRDAARLILFSIISSAILGGLGGLNQMHLNKIIAYSSLNHIGWMLQSLTMSLYLWSLYFLIYSSLLSSLCLIFHFFGVKHLKQLSDKTGKNLLTAVVMAFPLLSLAGLPPFSGFMIKLIVLAQLITQAQVVLTAVLLLSSLFSLFFYFRVLLSSVILSSYKSKTSLASHGLSLDRKTKLVLFSNFVVILFPSLALRVS